MIGQRLYRARKAAGLSLRDLGAQVGLSHAAIKKYEDGQATPTSTLRRRRRRWRYCRISRIPTASPT